MSQYSQEILKVVVAKICQTIGWHSIQTTPLEIMVDILRRYLSEITKHTQSYATLFGHTQPNLDELGLAFRDLHINIADLEEYVRYVESGPSIEAPRFPIRKDSHLNFLKPGSGEVVTRPVHVNEHLPPMFKISEETELLSQVKSEESTLASNADANHQSVAVFKRPADISPNESAVKRPRLIMEEEGRPTREISSVMMTTSGFLSPAREGKLPEARTPINAIESPIPSTSNNGNQLPNNVSAINETRFERKIPKIVREPKKLSEKRKDKTSKELFKPTVDDTIPAKKMSSMKDVARMKAIKQANIANNNTLLPPMHLHGSTKAIKSSTAKRNSQNKQQQAAKQFEKQTTPAPSLIALRKSNQMLLDKLIEGKLSSEPDKSKLNIFKKISKVKDEKSDKIEKHKLKEEPIDLESRESSPDLIIDETDMRNHHWENKVNKQIINEPIKVATPDIKHSPHHSMEKDFLYDDDLSPPGTPSTPKTPEMPTHSPPQMIEKENKRKRKEKTPKVKNKQPKMTRNNISPRRKNDSINFDSELERPKTPNDPINMIMKEDMIPNLIHPTKSPVFTLFPGLLPSGPGLIPAPMTNPLFPRLPLPLPKHGFGQPAHIPPAMPFIPVSSQPQINQVPLQSIRTHSPAAPVVDHVTIEKIPPVQPVEQQSLYPHQHQQQIKKLHSNDTVISPTKEKHKKDKKDKPKKKNKKDKIKNKSEKRKLKEEKKEKDKIKKKDKKKDKERDHEGSVPKLTLKIGSPRPPTPDVQIARKILIKPVVKKDEDQMPSVSTTSNIQEKREPSPELARISALITRPPKLKASTKPIIDHYTPNPNPNPNDQQPVIPTFHAKLKKNMFRSVPKIKNRDRKQRDSLDDVNELYSPPHIVESPHKVIPIPAPVVVAPTAFYIENQVKEEAAPLQNTSPKEKGGPLSGRSRNNANQNKQGPGTAVNTPQIAGVKTSNKQKPAVIKQQQSSVVDNDGNKVWICPACGGQDDGSPMIGCDDCDAWYHWVCVGIQVPPDDNEDWYCRICIVKKQETIQMDKKKKRKKKERKEH